ncbi:hypothetical protein RND81_09G234500 [Saponaria officinalis]
MGFLLRASLKWRGSRVLNRKWNFKTIGFVLLYCIPILVLDLLFVMVAPKLIGQHKLLKGLSYLFTRTHSSTTASGQPVITCTYPLLSTILHGIFAIVLTTYMLLLGRRMFVSVINKGLQKRVYILIFLVSSFLPLRVLLLGLSVLARPEHFIFEALAFCGFLALLSCVVVSFFMLVYLPVADSLALNRSRGWRSVEAGEVGLYTPGDDSTSLIDTNPSHHETSKATNIEDEASSTSKYEEEMTTPSPGFRRLSATSLGSPTRSLQ